jgi:pimeloyl-ACP methyl ester carboxylesterase
MVRAAPAAPVQGRLQLHPKMWIEQMIEDPRGQIDYAEFSTGTTLVLVPGSCSTGAAWRPVMATWNGQFRCVTTSLLGYGGTAERRTTGDPDISHEAEMLEAVVRRTGSRVHLVGHSFGGLVALSVALRSRVPLASLVILEAPAQEALRGRGERQHYRAFRQMRKAYFAAFDDGNEEAISTMIDFSGGAGTFASWPPRVRAYAVETTAVNIGDWASARGFALSAASLAALQIPTLVVRGGASHPAVQRANAVLAERISGAALATIDTAAHFMIATHPNEVGRLIARHVHWAEAVLYSEPFQSANGGDWHIADSAASEHRNEDEWRRAILQAVESR